MSTIPQLIQQRKVFVTLVVGAVVGLLLGLAIGWWWWPVEWTNSTPANLRSDFQSEYILWVAEEYANTGDLEEARRRLGASFWKEGQLAETLEQLENAHSDQQALDLRKLARDLEAEPSPAESTEEEEGAPVAGGGVRSLALVCGVGLLVAALAGGALLLITRLRERDEAAGEGPQFGRAVPRQPSEEKASWKGEDPVAQFVTTYVLGDEHYDPSFSIELENGEFMGECGVGISETIGVGEPSKVTALEIWLFDKNDIRTVTKVVMSDYAFHDEALRTKLAPKGEPVLAEGNKDVLLDTRTLHVQAHIVEVEYGTGELPPDSFFKRITIDLAAWPKEDREQRELEVETAETSV